jgi:hypothetical protein
MGRTKAKQINKQKTKKSSTLVTCLSHPSPSPPTLKTSFQATTGRVLKINRQQRAEF